MAWFSWRARHASLHPVWLALFAAEVLGLLSGVLLAAALLRSRPRHGHSDGSDVVAGPTSFPDTVARVLAEPPIGDPVQAIRAARVDSTSRRLTLPERALAVVALEGGRRCVIVVGLLAGLLLGTAPYPGFSPVWFAVGGFAVVTTSLGIAGLSDGAVRPGDRLAWSFAAIAPTLGARDRAGTVPIDWAWVMGAVVALNLAIALRGLSDRWTHGLSPMVHAERISTMTVALLCVGAGLVTMRRMPAPEPGVYDSAVRRVEERSARTTALAATALVALVGLVAGILPGAVDAADEPSPERREHGTELEVVVGAEAEPDPAEVGDALVRSPEMSAQGTNEP